LNAAVAIPNGAAPADVSLTEGSNFTFAGKTFNFTITFASGIYDEEMVDAIKGKFIAKGSSVGNPPRNKSAIQSP
jgi:hypothetical protein